MGYDNQKEIVKKTLWEQITDTLRENIIHGKIAPGERIVEEELALQYNVSRGPVREALRRIEEEGLVTYESRKGCRVKTISYKEMWENYLVRSTLEVLAVKILAGNLPEEYEAEMKKCLCAMEEAAKEKDLYKIILQDEAFHTCIIKAARCDTLYKVWATLRSGNIQAYYTMNVKQAVPFDVLRENHEVILTALKERPVDEVAKLIEYHYMVVPEEFLHRTQGNGDNESGR